MDLGLEAVRTTGRAAQPIMAAVVRELTTGDLALLGAEKGVKAPTIKKLRDKHHEIARLIAAEQHGTSEIAAATGYSASRISILRADPAFAQLVSFYKENMEAARSEAYADAQTKLAALNADAIEELHDRLLDAPETIGNDDLLDLVVKTSDRTGNGPQSKTTNLNLNVDLAARVATARQRVAGFRGPALTASGSPSPIEGEVVDCTPPSPPLAPEAGK